MRLSEAIRLGSLAIQNPQAGDSRFCAVGMACEAIGKRDMGREKFNYQIVAREWPWTEEDADGANMYLVLLWWTFDKKVMKGEMTLEALCDQVRVWEDELAAKGINVEQVTMIATPEMTHEPAAEQSEMVGARHSDSVRRGVE